jgi:hypothetical protein
MTRHPAGQHLGAGLLDELQPHLVPIMLGARERFFVDVGDPTPAQLRPADPRSAA